MQLAYHCYFSGDTVFLFVLHQRKLDSLEKLCTNKCHNDAHVNIGRLVNLES